MMRKNNTASRLGLIALTVLLLSSCSSLRKADDQSYSSRKTRTHKTTKTRSTTATSSRTKTTHNTSPTAATSKKKSEVVDNTTNTSLALRRNVVSIAKTYQGTPYVYGGESPSGFDCSGFLQYVYEQAGISIPRTSNQQAKIGKSKSWNQSSVGDIIIFGEPNRISHVGLVCEATGNSLKVIHSTSSRGVIVTDVSNSDYWRRRMLYARAVL